MQSASPSAHVDIRTPIRRIHCFCYFCLVLSCPWSFGLPGGRLGVLLHFVTAVGGAWLLEALLTWRKPLRNMP